MFEGQTALIIGGSSGMGRGAARAFTARGGTAVVTSRSEDRLDDAVAAVGDGDVRGVACDLADEASIERAVETLDRIDHLVVTAAPPKGVTDREFFDGKFWGTRAAATAAAARMPETGTMLFASGGLAVRPKPGTWSVTCAFAAVEALARALAIEHAPRRVNCIRPGFFDTAIWADMDDDERERMLAERAATLPAGRVAGEDDFGDAFVAHLTSRYLTGQIIPLDGGEALLSA